MLASGAARMGRALALAASFASTVAASAAAPDRSATDAVLIWNDQTNLAIQQTSTDAFRASRALALESIAVFDTVRPLDGGPGFLVRLPRPRDVPAGIAIAAAAHAMLSQLFPARHRALDAAFADALAHESVGPARDQAVAFGEAVANAVFAVRDHDGWRAAETGGGGIARGQWRPTPPDFGPPLVPQWAKLTPFAMTGPEQFRPPPPLGPGTPVFRDATAYVASIGGQRSPVRTASQTEIAHYWSDAIGTYAPAGHWNAIAGSLIAPLGLGLEAEAELFAKLNVAMADAGIAVADAKYTYWFWRPVTVIRAGGSGATPAADWTPLLNTPNHPSYISGHSGFSGAAAAVLTASFGTRQFSFSSASLPGVTRDFTSFQQAAEEAAASRVYGGIHYPFDNSAGLAAGRAVGAWTLAAFRRVAQDRGPVIVLDRPMIGAATGAGAATGTGVVTGFALDNHAPVTAVTVRLEGSAPFIVTVDDRGRFAIPPRRLAGGSRSLTIVANGVAGRMTTVRLETGVSMPAQAAGQ